MKLIPVIGLEIHAELLTKTKIFCSCENKFGNEPNTLVCPICSGMPGTLPSLNKACVELGAKAGLILNCKINNKSSFDRKNYFYKDLPKGYQITQFYNPICYDGIVKINDRNIRIERIHLEEDAGKLIHNDDYSVIDLNRCGVGLIEIVTMPDFHSADEVTEFIKLISLRMKYSNICDAKLEQGSLRVDVNISLKRENSLKFGQRAEIKNINSLKSIKQAIEYEIKRQTEILSKGGQILAETRRFDERTGTTVFMRTKETKGDYRYFPEPDLPHIFITDEDIEKLKQELPIMPDERYLTYIDVYKLSKQEAQLLTDDKFISDFYDSCVAIYPSCKTISNILLNEVKKILNKRAISFSCVSFSPKDIVELSKLYDEKKITKSSLSYILDIMIKTNESPTKIAISHNLLADDTADDLDFIITKVLEENPKAVNEYLGGNKKVFAFLMGQIMRSSNKGTNPNTVTEILSKKLLTFLEN